MGMLKDHAPNQTKMEFVTIDELVSSDHLLRKNDNKIDTAAFINSSKYDPVFMFLCFLFVLNARAIKLLFADDEQNQGLLNLSLATR